MPVTGTRRDFLKQTSELALLLFGSIQRAAAIDPEPGSTFEGAEHVVILMQENRSFDHTFGALRGVRGFNDPRAVTLPDGNPVWKQGGKHVPFRLDLRGTKATWLGSLPHSWRDQIDARNHGNHDRWLEAKPSSRRECAGMPFTMGYYDRRDLPFYYALADAFTICDQNFCSSLTGTTPNRLHLWTGTIRDPKTGNQHVRNSEVTYSSTVNWKTYPERLEDAGVSWRIYQNEISLDTGLHEEADAWLANFTDNSIEWFDQYNVGFHKLYRPELERIAARLPEEIRNASNDRLRQRRQTQLDFVTRELAKWTPEREAKLTARERSLHDKAFTTNEGDPDYRTLTKHRYRDEKGVEREMQVPKGDPLHRFRRDVESGKLPKVSWLVPPERFSDHPGSPWYGAWYIAEAMNILTRNPEVWKKTIFVLTYDENDGYFDHVPPFVAPDPTRPESGKVTAGLDASVEYWPLAHDRARAKPATDARGGPVGLGYRVPMIIASPWSRGGYVCSQVFDHTSVLQLLERVCKVRETNISAWRRTVCGDLATAFRAFRTGEGAEETLPYPKREAVLEEIHKAQYQPLPEAWQVPASMPKQEPGTRKSLSLPYELSAEATVQGGALALLLVAGNKRFGRRAAGSGFHVYTPGLYRGSTEFRTRAYAVEPGAALSDSWALDGFPDSRYDLCVCGPNGFFRHFRGAAKAADEPQIQIRCEDLGDSVAIRVASNGKYTVRVRDVSYGSGSSTLTKRQTVFTLQKSNRWYDLEVTIVEAPGYLRRYAGRVENGLHGVSDPAMA